MLKTKEKVNCLSCNTTNLLEKNIFDIEVMMFCCHCHNLLNEIIYTINIIKGNKK